MDWITASMTARIEHQQIGAQAEEPWRRMRPAGGGRLRGAGLIARLRALVARSGVPLHERTRAISAKAPSHERGAAGATD